MCSSVFCNLLTCKSCASIQVALRGVLISRVATCTFLASNWQKEIEAARACVHTKDTSVIYLFPGTLAVIQQRCSFCFWGTLTDFPVGATY